MQSVELYAVTVMEPASAVPTRQTRAKRKLTVARMLAVLVMLQTGSRWLGRFQNNQSEEIHEKAVVKDWIQDARQRAPLCHAHKKVSIA